MCLYTTTLSLPPKHICPTFFGVLVNQQNHFPPNIWGFPLPTRPQWVEPAGGEERKSGGEQKSADVEQKTHVNLAFPEKALQSKIPPKLICIKNICSNEQKCSFEQRRKQFLKLNYFCLLNYSVSPLGAFYYNAQFLYVYSCLQPKLKFEINTRL